MTRDAIADELFPLLNEEPTTKERVVYVLLKIRKMLEHDKKPADYVMLNFFCDWVAHTELSFAGARKVLAMLDERLPTFYRKPEQWDPDGVVHNILSFHLLRQQLSKFLQGNDLPTRWVEDDFTWIAVVRFYGEQVRETPLFIADAKHTLKYIRRVEIVACEPSKHIVEANPSQKHYGFKWLVTMNNGKTFSWPYTSNLPEKPANWPPQGVKIERES